MLDFLKAVVLGLIQGLTEFLPISSSAHLRIFPELFGWGDPGAAFTAVVQIGTEVAVLLYFRKDIWRIASAWLRSLVKPELRGAVDSRMGWYIIVGSLPIVLLGVALKDVIERDFRNLWIIGTTLVVLGVILGIADRVGRTDRTIDRMTLRHAILLGVAQACALVPGVSRSGATISMGRLLGYDREAATRFAFLLAIPAVVGAGIFELPEIPGGDNAYGPWSDPRRHDRRLRRRVRRHRLAAALRHDPVLPAVRALPDRARERDPRAGRSRRAERVASRYNQPDFLNSR